MLSLMLPIALVLNTELPTVTVESDDVRIDRSCRIAVAKPVIDDANRNGIIHVVASDVVLEFADEAALRGAPPTTTPDGYAGFGIRIDGQQNVTIRGGRLSGFRAALWATQADDLVLEDVDASDNLRKRLLSEPLVEVSEDWISPHRNDNNEWLANYGAALYIEDSHDITVRRCRVHHGQNGLCLDRVTDGRIYDNDFSFNSGWGIALWRSSRNTITRNAVDFCIRGYSHGIYNRGQDSAGILAFEQNSDNVIAENSGTHGGDGFFGFAGLEAIGQADQIPAGFDHRRAGNNDNLLIRNDFSFAAAHGIENTFSFGNRYLANRLVGNCICGIWGGYSQETLIARNKLADNGAMPYGLERGGINIDSGRENRIVNNEFRDNRCGVHLWWQDSYRDEWTWGQVNLNGWEGNLIAGNTFVGDDVAVHARGPGRVVIGPNEYERVDDVLRSEPEVAIERREETTVPEVALPDYAVWGKTTPIGARKHLAGRDNIIMTEWGPWDHEAPLVRLIRDEGAVHTYELRNLAGEPRVTVTGKGVETTRKQDADQQRRLVSVSSNEEGLRAYTLEVTAGDFSCEKSGTLFSAAWNITFFPYDVDATKELEAWRAAGQAPDAQRKVARHLYFVRPAEGGRPAYPAGGLALDDVPQRFGTIARASIRLEAGAYIVSAIGHDGVRVMIDDETVIESWQRRWFPIRETAEIQIQESRTVDVVVEHFHEVRAAVLKFGIAPQTRPVEAP